MRTIKSKSLIALLAAMLLIVSTIGVTVAYFSDNDSAEGSGALNLVPETTIDEGTDDAVKNVVITNTGNSDVIVRVAFYGPDNMNVTPNSNWTKSGDWYYYKSVLKPGSNTGNALVAALNELDEKAQAELGDTLYVTVVHESAVVTYENGKIKAPNGWDASAIPAQ